MTRFQQGTSLFLGLLLAAGIVLMPQSEAAKRGGGMIVFTAKWCASCRSIVPIVQQLGTQNNMPVTVIDVDAPNAPAQARDNGLSIPTNELPQVYQTSGGGTKLLFDGRQYKFGLDDLVRATILHNLQGSAP